MKQAHTCTAVVTSFDEFGVHPRAFRNSEWVLLYYRAPLFISPKPHSIEGG